MPATRNSGVKSRSRRFPKSSPGTEGIGFGDLESEHAFLRWRFSEADYRYLARDDLDQDRLAYYKLRMHVSLVYAGSRLLLRGYSAKELAQQILSGNLAELRRLLGL